MRGLAASLALCALAACTYDEKEFAGPFSCAGQPDPTTAPKLIHIGGRIFEPSDLSAIAGATVMLQNAQMTSVFPPVTTDATGAFSFAFNTNGTPATGLDLVASGSGHVSMYFYPTHALVADTSEQIALLSAPEAAALASGGGVPGPDATHGAALLTIADCNGSGFSDAVVTTSPPGMVRYFNGVQISPTLTATGIGGVALVANLPPGPVVATVKVQGNTLPARTFTVVANAFVQSTIDPAD